MQNENVKNLIENIEKRFVGKQRVVSNLVISLLAGGHILIEDVPGVGKTKLAKSLAESMEAGFARMQFTPDTLPSDITGSTIYDAKTSQFRTVQGPIFNEIVLADEINRTSPKTQSALLEAMQEKQVTIDGKTYPLPELFMVIATQNPVEQIGTYMLPEAELDRFLMKISIGYPDSTMQMRLAKRHLDGSLEETLAPVLKASDVVEMRKEVKQVIMSDELIQYALDIVEKSRHNDNLEYGLSPRASLDLLSASKASAYVNGRDFVTPDDVIDMAKACLPHRMLLTTEAKMNKYTGKQLILDIVGTIPRPR